MNSQNSMDKIIKVIRALGAMALILSAIIFLLQGITAWDSFERFLVFTGMNTLLGGLGLFCATKWNEPKGARTFLTLATAGVSAQFAQLAGMVFNQFSSQASQVPSFFAIEASGLMEFGLAIGLVALVSMPLAYLGFKVLNRSDAKLFTAVYGLGNLFILMPYRGVEVTLITVSIMTVLMVYLIKRFDILNAWKMTQEKFLSIFLLMAPAIIVLGRNLFYDFGALFMAALFMVFALVSFMIYKYKESNAIEDPTRTTSYRKGKIVPTILWSTLSWLSVCFSMLNATDFPFMLCAVFFTIPVYFLIRCLVSREMMYKGDFRAGVALLTVFSGASLLWSFSYVNAILVLVIGIIFVIDSYKYKVKAGFLCGILLTVFAGGSFAVLTIETVNLFHWLNLAILGGVAILATSFMEKNSQKISTWKTKLNERF